MRYDEIYNSVVEFLHYEVINELTFSEQNASNNSFGDKTTCMFILQHLFCIYKCFCGNIFHRTFYVQIFSINNVAVEREKKNRECVTING